MTQAVTMAYIGNGKSTNRYHLPYVLQRPEQFHVKTIWKHSDKPSSWKTYEGIHYTLDLDAVLQDPEISLVVVTTPASAHYDMTKKVLEAGKNCVCEKPFTETPEEAAELFALAKEKGVVLEVYQNRRFDSDFLTVQKVIESGKLGELYEMEMHFDYDRPEVPERSTSLRKANSFLYGHACHTVDQVISYFGIPEKTHYEVKQMLGKDHMNDYFDLDLFYGSLKVSVKSSYFRIKARPSFAVYGRKGMFIKEKKDRQEADLKKFYLPDHADFGIDQPEDYGTLTYRDENGMIHEEKVISERGDYGMYYDALYRTLVYAEKPLVAENETMAQMRILDEAFNTCINGETDGE